MSRLQQLDRRANTIVRRTVRNVHLAICHAPVVIAAWVTRLAASLPADRDTQDRALFAVGAFALLVIGGVL